MPEVLLPEGGETHPTFWSCNISFDMLFYAVEKSSEMTRTTKEKILKILGDLNTYINLEPPRLVCQTRLPWLSHFTFHLFYLVTVTCDSDPIISNSSMKEIAKMQNIHRLSHRTKYIQKGGVPYTI